jgi:hypothetical protein
MRRTLPLLFVGLGLTVSQAFAGCVFVGEICGRIQGYNCGLCGADLYIYNCPSGVQRIVAGCCFCT